MKQALSVGWAIVLASCLHVAPVHAQAFTPLSWTFYANSGVADPADASGRGFGVSVSHLSVGGAYPVAFARGRCSLSTACGIIGWASATRTDSWSLPTRARFTTSGTTFR